MADKGCFQVLDVHHDSTPRYRLSTQIALKLVPVHTGFLTPSAEPFEQHFPDMMIEVANHSAVVFLAISAILSNFVPV